MDERLRTLSLFSGSGAYDLGLEWAGGFETVGFVENDPYCQNLLGERFPGARVFGDIREFDPAQIPGTIDLVHGGFPCQDISTAGRGAGIEGERSSLWSEFARCVCLARPRYVIVENVPALKDRGMGVVLGSLAFGGYDAEWDCISALSVGCIYSDPQADTEGTIRFQHRNRLWFLATIPDTDRERLWKESVADCGRIRPFFITDYGEDECVADTDSLRCQPKKEDARAGQPDDGRSGGSMADPIGNGQDGTPVSILEGRPQQEDHVPAGCSEGVAYTKDQRYERNGTSWGGRDGFEDRREGVGMADAKDEDRLLGGDRDAEIFRERPEKADLFVPELGILERARREDLLARFRERTYECWAAEPCVRSIPARTPNWVDEIRLCGNTNPPQILQYIGELINNHKKTGGVKMNDAGGDQ